MRQLQAQLTAARRTLLVLIGRGTDPLDSVPVSTDLPAPPAVPATTPGELLARRPDVREAEQRLRSASARLDIDKLALFPTFTLEPGLSITKLSTKVYDLTTRSWSLGAAGVLPILNRPQLLAEIRAQTARGDQAAASYESAVQGAYRDAENALATLAAEQKRVADLARAAERAEFAFQAAQKGNTAGLTDLTTLLQAEQTWRAARNQLITARAAALQDTVNAMKALGGGWQAEAGDRGIKG